jgi:hypothetical protein
MKLIFSCHDSDWVELETDFEAKEESELGFHEVSYYFKHDQIPGSAGAKYYSLRLRVPEGNPPKPLVTIRIPNTASSMRQKNLGEIIVVGANNSDPYKLYASHIHSLETHLCVPLPSTCYPYC